MYDSLTLNMFEQKCISVRSSSGLLGIWSDSKECLGKFLNLYVRIVFSKSIGCGFDDFLCLFEIGIQVFINLASPIAITSSFGGSTLDIEYIIESFSSHKVRKTQKT